MSILNLLFFISDKSRESLLHCRSWSGQPGKLKAILCLLWSIRYFKLLFQKSIPFCLQHWADILCWQQKAKNLKWKCIHTFASALANNIAKKFFVTGMVHKLENILNNIMNMVQSCVEKENSLSCSNLNYLSTPESFIFLSPTPFWVQKEGNWKTNDVEFCSDCAYRHGWIHF